MGVAFVDSQIYTVSLIAIRNLIVAADISRSVSLIRFQVSTYRSFSLPVMCKGLLDSFKNDLPCGLSGSTKSLNCTYLWRVSLFCLPASLNSPNIFCLTRPQLHSLHLAGFGSKKEISKNTRICQGCKKPRYKIQLTNLREIVSQGIYISP